MFSVASLTKSIPPPIYTTARSLMAAQSSSNNKKLIKIDISSDTVCPWCLVGKKNLEKAMALSQDKFDFQVKWHPFILNPHLSKEGVVKKDHFMKKFGSRYESVLSDWVNAFRRHGLEYNISGLTGSTMDSHRLIAYAGHQGLDKQNALVEELFLGYFTQGKYLGDLEYLVESANKVGIEGAEEYLKDPNNGLQEVKEELEKYSSSISAVPHFVINGTKRMSGGQPPEYFISAFEDAAENSA